VAAIRTTTGLRWSAAILLAPSLLLVVALLFIPVLQLTEASFHVSSYGALQPEFTVQHYKEVMGSAQYAYLFGATFLAAAVVTLACLVLGYPLAAQLAYASPRWRGVLYFLLTAPLLVNTVVRTYGWLLILGRQGVVNSILVNGGFLSSPLVLSGTYLGMIIGATQVFLPFMALSIATSLEGIDRRLIESSDVMGASPARTFLRVVLPLSMPGVISGCVLVFSLMLGAFVTPLILGGSAIRYLSVAVYTDALVLFNLPRAVALALILLLCVIVIDAAQRVLLRRYARFS
jgi:putative spermidine/putrescine transport system permease protein